MRVSRVVLVSVRYMVEIEEKVLGMWRRLMKRQDQMMLVMVLATKKFESMPRLR